MKRPLQVTIICWLIIAFAVLTFLTLIPFMTRFDQAANLIMQKYNVPRAMLTWSLFHSLVLVVLNIILAILMLKGVNWGRLTYLVLGIASNIFNFVTTPEKLMVVISAIVFIMFLLFLFSRKANEFFRHAKREQVTTPQ